MRFKLSFGDIYLAIWCLYYLQGVLYDASGFIGKALFVVILLLSLYFVFYTNLHFKLSRYFKSLNALVIVFGIYGVAHILFDSSSLYGVPTFYYLKVIYLSYLPIYVFYVLVKQGKFDENKLRKWILIFCVVATASYYKSQEAALMVAKGDETTNNAGYIFLAILPLTALYHGKPIVQFALIAFCSFFIVMAMKRGAIFIALIVIVILVHNMTKNSKNYVKVFSYVLVSVFFVGAFYFVNYMFSTSDYFSYRWEQTLEGNTSNRDIIYSNLYDAFINQSDAISLIFGRGADATLKLFGGYAHNDWLEIAINNGLLGVFLYLSYYISFFIVWYKTPRNSTIRIALGTALLIVFLKSFFSMSYSNTTIYATSLIGYCMAMIEKPNLEEI